MGLSRRPGSFQTIDNGSDEAAGIAGLASADLPSATAAAIHDVVFIDSRVPDIQDLLNGLKPGEQAFVIDSGSDGLDQIAGILKAEHLDNLSGIQIVSHGASGVLQLGATTINDTDLSGHASALASIGAALVSGGDLSLYTCNVAQGGAGQQFIADLSHLAGGVEVAAATHDIGSTAGGEDWTLDATAGGSDSVAQAPAHIASPFTAAAEANFDGTLAQPTAELWIAATSGGPNNLIIHADDTGTNTASNIGTLFTPVSANNPSVADGINGTDLLQFDTQDQKYFIATQDTTTTLLLEGSLASVLANPTATPTYTTLFSSSTDDVNGISLTGLAVDPASQQVFFDDGHNFYKESYNGSLNSETLIGSTGSTSSDPFLDGLALDLPHHVAYFASGTSSTTTTTTKNGLPDRSDPNGNIHYNTVFTASIYETSNLTSSSSSVAITKLVDIPAADGPIFGGLGVPGLAVDTKTGTVYFTTQTVVGSSTVEGGVFALDPSTKAITTLFRQDGVHGPTGILNAIQVDDATGLYYVSMIGPHGDGGQVWVGSLSGGTPTLFETLPTFTSGANTIQPAPLGFAIDNAPSLTATSADPTFTESALNPASAHNTPVTPISSATAGDTDNDKLAGATVSISTGLFAGDALSVTLTGNITVASNTGGVLTLTGADTLANYDAVLNSVHFTSTSDNPTNYGADTSRTITYTVSDGLLSSATITSTVTVAAVNDAPAITVVGGDSTSLALTETNAGLSGSHTLTVTDPDSLSQTITTSLVSHTGPVDGISDATLAGFFSAGSPVSTSTGTGTITYTFNSGAEAFNFLGAGQQLVVTYNIHDVDSADTGASQPVDQQVTVTITGVNDAPVVTAGGTLAYTENDAPTVIAAGASVTDVDSADFNTGSLTVAASGNHAEDQLSILQDAHVTVSGSTVSIDGNAVGTINAVNNGVNGASLEIDFNSANATPGAVTTLMDHIDYADSSDDPSTAARTVTFTVNDGDGTANGGVAMASASSTVNVTAVNDPPVNHVPAAQAINEDDTLVFNTANGNLISITDPDAEAGNETVTLSVNHGALTLGSLAGLSFSTGDGTADASMTFSGTLASVNSALNGLSYAMPANGNGSDTLTITTNDNGNTPGPAQQDQDTVAITVNPVNDAPVVINGTTAALVAINEDATDPVGAPISTLVGGHFSDAADDQTANGGSGPNAFAGIAVTANAATAGQGTWQYFSGGSWNDFPVVSTASALLLDAATSVRFLPAANFNGTPGALTVHLVDDSAGTITDGATADLTTVGNATPFSTGTVTISETVNPVNDAPVFSSLDNTPGFTEGGAAVVLDGNATVTDVDLAALGGGSGNYAGATLTLARDGGASAQDVFAGSGTLTLAGGNVQIGATTVGTFTNTGGTLAITFNASASSTSVNSVLDQLTYANNSDAPPTSVQVDYAFSDGNTGSQGPGGPLTATGHVTVGITAVNDAPDLTPNAPVAVTFFKGQASPVALLATGAVTDPDNPANFNGGSLTIAVSSGVQVGDDIVLLGTSPITNNSGTLMDGATAIGTVTGLGSSSVSISLNASATPAEVDKLVESFGFQTTATTTGDRSVTFTFKDGGHTGGSAPGLSDTVTQTVHVATPVASQLVFLTSGNDANGDASIQVADSNDTTGSIFLSYGVDEGNAGPVSTPVNKTIVDPAQIVGDTAAGLAFIVDPQFTGDGSQPGKVIEASLTSPTQATTVAYAVPNTNTFSELFSIAIDTTNHVVYASEIQFNSNLDDYDPASGIVKFSYNPVTGATGPAQAVYEPGTGIVNTYDSLSFDTSHQKLYFVNNSEGQFGSSPSTNDIEVLSNLSGAGTPTVLTTLPSGANFFQSDGTNDYTKGNIESVAVDTTENLVFFSTGTGPGVDSAHRAYEALNGIWVIDGSTANQTARELVTDPTFTVNGVTDHFAPISMSFDSAHQQLWVDYESEDDSNANGADLGVVVVYNVTGTTPGTVSLSAPTIVNVELLGETVANLTNDDFPLSSFINDLPVLSSVNGTTTHAVEQGAAVTLLTGAPTVTDPDGTHLASATIAITGGTFSSNENSNADDHLGFAAADVTGNQINGTNITFSYDSATETLTLSGYDTLANYQTALGEVQYSTTGDNPTNFGVDTARTITWQVNDGAIGNPVGGNTATTSISINAVNDAPTNTAPANASVNEDTSLAFTGGNTISVSDPDNQTLTVTLTGGNGPVTLGSVTNLTVTGTNGSASVAISGTIADINAALATLSYKGDANFNGPDTLTVDSFDGTAHTQSTVNITVNPVNDAPVLDLDANNSSGASNADFQATYQVGAAGVAIADTDVSITDVDNTTIASATITLTNHQANDVLSINGTLPSTITTAGYDSATGVLTLTGNGSATEADFEAALHQIQFSNSSGTPSFTDRVVTVVVDDGQASNHASNIATATIHVANPTDAAPVIANLSGDTSSFTEGGSAVHIDVGTPATVTDSDSTDFDTGNLTVHVATNGVGAEDVLGIDTAPATTVTLSGGLTPGSHVMVGGVDVGTIAVNGDGTGGHNLVVDLDANATPANVGVLIDALTYVNSNQGDPSTAARTVTVSVNDGDGATGSASATVDVTGVNDPPTVTATGSNPTFTENGAAVDLFSGVSVSAVEAADNIEKLVLTVTGPDTDNQQLGIDGSTFALGNDSGFTTATNGLSFNSSVSGDVVTITLSKAGGVSAATMASIIDGMTYADLGDSPTAGNAVVMLTSIQDTGGTANGGQDTTSLSISSTVNVVAVNDAPVATITTNPYSATEQTALDLKGSMAVNDADGLGHTEEITVSVGEGTLNATAGDSGVTIVSGNGTSTLVVDGTLAQLNAFIFAGSTSTLSYIDNTDAPAASTTLTLAINDEGATGTGGPLSGSTSSTINITAVNDAPTATITPASYAGTPGIQLNLKNSGLSVGDVDGENGSETVTLSVTSGTLTVTAGGSGAGVSNSGTNSVTISGTVAQIDALLNTDNMSTVVFFDNSNAAVRTLTLAINDNGNTGGGPLTAQDTAQIVFDKPPVVDLNGAAAGSGVTLVYTENQAATVIAPAGTVSDTDSPNFNNGSLTVHLTGGLAQDQLSILAGGPVTVSSGTVSVGGHAVGTVTGGANGSDLVVHFNTADATPAAITTLTEHIAYADTSDDPAASRSITFTVDDGQGATGSAAATVNITAVNDAPGATVPPIVSAPHIFIDPYTTTEQTTLNLKHTGLAVFDVDSDGAGETAFLSVTEGTLTVTAGTSGAIVTGSGTLAVAISGTLAQINALLNTDGTSTVSYVDNTDNPGASTLTLAIDDNGHTGSGGPLTGFASIPIIVNPVNDAPVATITPASYAATEQTTLNLKNNGLSVSDADGNGGSETVTLSVGEGTLSVAAGSSGAVVSGSGTGSVTINGTVAQIDALLNTDGSSTVSYIDNTDTPAASAALTLTIHDNGHTGAGGNLSSSDTATINITAVNDAPVAVIATNPYHFDPGVALDLKNSGMSVSDVDGNGGSETVTLSVSEGALTLAAGTSGAVIDSGNGTDAVTFHGTIAQLDALLNTNATSAVSFLDNGANPADSVQLSLSINDNGHTGAGGAHSDTASSVIDNLFANDPGGFDFNFDNNGNGHADLLLQNSSSGAVSIWESGQPTGAVTVATAVPDSWHLEGIGDFDGNGKGDILWENSDGRVAIWDNGQTGHTIAAGIPDNWHIVGTGDFDGNGKSDILWQNDDGRVAIWDDGQTGHTVAGPGSMLPADERVVATGDFNGDGKTDILWQNTGNGALTVWNDGQPAGATTIGTTPANSHVVGVGDFDGNGKSDIVWQNTTNGALTIWGDGLPANATTVAGSLPASWHVDGVGDFDDNGKSDLVLHNDDGRVAIWDNGQIGHTVAGPGTLLPDFHILA